MSEEDTLPPDTPKSITLSIYKTVRELAAKGHSKTYVGKVVGRHPETLRKIPGITWPRQGHSLEVWRYRERQKSPDFRAWRSRVILEEKRGKKYDVGDGRELTAREIAEEVGLSASSVRGRVRRGSQGSDLLRPPKMPINGPPKYNRYETWTLNLSQSDWKIVLDYARETTPVKASRKLQVPVGAIKAMLRGETWRVKNAKSK